jgi:hypothetical protein
MDLAGDEREFVFRWPGPIGAVDWRPRFAPADGAWRIMVERNKNQRSNARDGSVHRVEFVELLRQVLDEVPDVGHHFRSTDDAEVDRAPVVREFSMYGKLEWTPGSCLIGRLTGRPRP